MYITDIKLFQIDPKTYYSHYLKMWLVATTPKMHEQRVWWLKPQNLKYSFQSIMLMILRGKNRFKSEKCPNHFHISGVSIERTILNKTQNIYYTFRTEKRAWVAYYSKIAQELCEQSSQHLKLACRQNHFSFFKLSCNVGHT